ncbi:MAG: hypothetical protein U5R46_02875 [Gammaproteobacteria bacterium]|nr:hypothetical protein [Gammaproteobacteria bacterium]
MGALGLGMALLACYGTLAAVGLLGLYGVGLMLNQTVWAGAIALFTVLAAASTVAGVWVHGSCGPPACGLLGGELVLYALFVDYHVLVELAGFLVLGAAVAWDLYRRRRNESRILGLGEASH